ncbi:MAG: TonB-dependent receptor [Bacteroides sp.]|nr:TonB-dependent receptor [Bacteroides sp.]
MRQKIFSRKLVQLLSLCCLFFLSIPGAYAQNGITVKGQVVDAGTNEPLIGVSIQEKGTTNGIITDFDGNFTLNVTNGATVVFSYIGYQTVELPAASVKGTIKLHEDTEMLQEVVVVGYGTQKKVNLSGSVAAIEGDKIAAKPSSNALAALQGELPGLAVLRSSGQPGAETSGMRIRGFSSVNDTQTLVLIDGIEGDLTLVNPNDIASISVLKDAAACAIYGARAAAGVVLVTTKNGTEGKPRISYNGYYGFNLPANMPERLPAWEEQEFINQSRIPTTGKVEWTAEKSSWVGNPNFNTRPLSNGRWDLFEATNWVEEGTKDHTAQQNHSISVSGGSKNMNYMLSANFYTKDGLLKYGPDGNERYNLLAKINATLNKYVDLGIHAQYQSTSVEQSSYGSTGLFYLLYSSRGRQPIYNPEGDESGNIYNGDLQANAIDIMKNGGSRETQYEAFTGKANLTIKDVVKGLRINLSASRKAGYYSERSEARTLLWKDRYGNNIRSSYADPNSLYKKKNSDYHDLLEATVNYTFDFNKEHNFNILAGSSYEIYHKDEIDATAKNMNSNDFFSFNYYDTSVNTNTEIGDNIEDWRMMSYFGRINYNYKERYLFEANVRYDGSSRLTPTKRWKAFPSVSAAWRLSEESWFDVKWISQLKLRASWGQLGNGAILGLYDYIPLINDSQNNTSATYMGEKWFYQKEMASKDKTWETIETTNLGIDFGFFNNRLSGSFEYYWKYNNNMLAAMQFPHQIGIDVPSMNVGKLKTWGWDFNISWKDKIKDVNYQVSFNISDSDNKLVEYDGASTISAGSVTRLEGYALNTIWGYQTDGFWSSSEEYLAYKEANPGYKSFNDGNVAGGDVKYVAQGKADHEIGVGGATPEDPGDLVCLGNSNGRYLYGLNLSAQWKGFDVSIMFQGVAKRKVVINPEAFAPLYQDYMMPWTIHRDYWTEDNQDAYWPRLYQYKGNDFNFKTSDRWVQNGAYFRLKNLTVGYTLPVFKKYIERLRVYVTGEDLWEHSDMLEVFDPEIGNNASRWIYPFFRTWTVGVNLSF